MLLLKFILCILAFPVLAGVMGTHDFFPNYASIPRTHQEHAKLVQEHLDEEDLRPENPSLYETHEASLSFLNLKSYFTDLWERVFPEGKAPAHIAKPKIIQAPGNLNTGSGGGGGEPSKSSSASASAEPSSSDLPSPEKESEIETLIQTLQKNIISGPMEQFFRTYDALSPQIQIEIKKRDNQFLKICSILGTLDIFKSLVQRGFDINQLSKGSSTPMLLDLPGAGTHLNYVATVAHYAIINKNSEVFQYLLEQDNFDPCLQDSQGRSLLKIAHDLKRLAYIRNIARSRHVKKLIAATKTVQDPLIKPINNLLMFKQSLQEERGVNIGNVLEWQNTVASWVYLGEYEAIAQFIAKYPEISVQQFGDYFLIHRLVQGFDMEQKHQLDDYAVLFQLLNQILQQNPDVVNQRDIHHQTPLDLAIQNGDPEVIRLLGSIGNVSLESIRSYLANRNLSKTTREVLETVLRSKKFLEPTESLSRVELENEQRAAFERILDCSADNLKALERCRQEGLEIQRQECQNLEKEAGLCSESLSRTEKEAWQNLVGDWNNLLKPIKQRQKEAARIAQEQAKQQAKQQALQMAQEEARQRFLAATQELEIQESKSRESILANVFGGLGELGQIMTVGAERIRLQAVQKEAQKRIQEQKRIQAEEDNLRTVLEQAQHTPEIAECPPLYAAVFLSNARAIAYLMGQPTTDPKFRFGGYTALSLAIHADGIALGILRVLLNTQHASRLLQEPIALEEGRDYPAIFYAVKYRKLSKLNILVEAMNAEQIQLTSVLLNGQNLLDFTKNLFGDKPKKGSEEHRILKAVQDWFDKSKA